MSYPRPTKDILRDLDEASATGRGLVSPSPDFAAGRLAGLREAAEVATATADKLLLDAENPPRIVQHRIGAAYEVRDAILALTEGVEG